MSGQESSTSALDDRVIQKVLLMILYQENFINKATYSNVLKDYHVKDIKTKEVT